VVPGDDHGLREAAMGFVYIAGGQGARLEARLGALGGQKKTNLAGEALALVGPQDRAQFVSLAQELDLATGFGKTHVEWVAAAFAK